MKKQIDFVNMLLNDLNDDLKSYMSAGKDQYGYTNSFMNKNYGKSVLMRKIVTIRQELLNLSKIIEKEK